MKLLTFLLTIILSFLIVFSSFSQTYKVDEKRIYSWNQSISPAAWEQNATWQYTYANGGNKETNIVIWAFPNPEKLFQHNKTYNLSNNIILDVMQFWNSVSMSWNDSSKDIYDYDGDGNLVSETSQTYNFATMMFENNYRDLTEYSGADVSQQRTQKWNLSTMIWENDELFELTYMSPGNPFQAFYSEWNMSTSMWDLYERDTATYDMGLISEILTETPDGVGGWDKFSRTLFTYDGGLETELLTQTWDGANWVNEDRDSSTYDANGNQIINIYESWVSGAWEPFYKEEKTYSVAGSLSTEFFEKKNLQVFPNPVSNILSISSSNIIDKLEVYNVLGKKIMQSSNVKQLNVEYLKTGIYLLKVYSNNRSTTKKIVIN